MVDNPSLLIGQHLAENLIQAHHASDRLRCAAVIPRDHRNLHAHFMQLFDRILAVGFDRICYGNDAHEFVIKHRKHRRFAVICQVLTELQSSLIQRKEFFDHFLIADAQRFAFVIDDNAHARQSPEAADFRQAQALRFGCP